MSPDKGAEGVQSMPYQALLFLLVIGALASLYPAFRATRIDVTEAMKFER